MSLQGVNPYDEKSAAAYRKGKWWLDLTLGDMFDRTCDLFGDKEALVGGDEIIDHLQRLEASRILIPARFEFVSEIPLTAAGKADKKELKKEIEEKLRAEAAGG